MNELKKYIRQTRSYEAFKKMKFKWSEGTGNDFPKLSVKVRAELVAFGYPTEIKVDKNGIVGGGKHLKPHQVEELIKHRGDDVVFFDGRNAYEAKVGKFKNAIIKLLFVIITSSNAFPIWRNGKLEKGAKEEEKSIFLNNRSNLFQ